MKDNSQALSQDIDIREIQKLQNRIDNNSSLLDGIVNRLVNSYCKQLDEDVAQIRDILQDEDKPITSEELDFYALQLSVSLYYVGEGQETLGIREDISKAIRQEAYNEAYEKATQGKATIADKTAQAELASMNEYLTNTAYTRAYKKIRLRAEAGQELLQSIKKVVSRRISEFEMSKVNVGGNR